MPSKKSPSKKSTTDVMPVVELPPSYVVPENIDAKQVCLYCRAVSLGTWRGPFCTNRQSPKYHQRVRDEGTCDKFIAPGSPARAEPVDAEGLYTPEVNPLQAMLDRETEAPDA